MKKLLLILLCVPLIFSNCSNEEKDNKIEWGDPKLAVKNDETQVDKPFSVNDSRNLLIAKLKEIAELDSLQFGNKMVFDGFYNDNVEKFYLKSYNSDQRPITIVYYDNQIKYIKILLENFDESENINYYKEKYTTILDQSINTGVFKRIRGSKYMTVTEGNEIWNLIWTIWGDKNCWYIITPENELNYLKFMINDFKKNAPFEIILL